MNDFFSGRFSSKKPKDIYLERRAFNGNDELARQQKQREYDLQHPQLAPTPDFGYPITPSWQPPHDGSY